MSRAGASFGSTRFHQIYCLGQHHRSTGRFAVQPHHVDNLGCRYQKHQRLYGVAAAFELRELCVFLTLEDSFTILQSMLVYQWEVVLVRYDWCLPVATIHSVHSHGLAPLSFV